MNCSTNFRQSISNAEFDILDAARSGTLADVEEAIRDGCDVGSCDSQGMSPLHLAAARGSVAIIHVLRSNGADINATDSAGQTPLHAAIVHDRFAAVEELSAAGCKVDVPDIRGFTPLHHAVIPFEILAETWYNHLPFSYNHFRPTIRRDNHLLLI
jgi:hypothetical protein